MKLPSLVFTDIDGVWTDGGMYYDETGNEWKKFNTSDSAGVALLREQRVETAIITGEKTRIVERRAEKLNILHCLQGIDRKLEAAEALLRELDLSFDEVAFLGDDLTDIPLLRKAGLSACPANAPEYLKSEVDRVLDFRGGDGAYRAFAETILEECGLLEDSIRSFLKRKEG